MSNTRSKPEQQLLTIHAQCVRPLLGPAHCSLWGFCGAYICKQARHAAVKQWQVRSQPHHVLGVHEHQALQQSAGDDGQHVFWDAAQLQDSGNTKNTITSPSGQHICVTCG